MQSICRQNGQLWQVSYFESQLEKKKKRQAKSLCRNTQKLRMDLGFS